MSCYLRNLLLRTGVTSKLNENARFATELKRRSRLVCRAPADRRVLCESRVPITDTLHKRINATRFFLFPCTSMLKARLQWQRISQQSHVFFGRANAEQFVLYRRTVHQSPPISRTPVRSDFNADVRVASSDSMDDEMIPHNHIYTGSHTET